MSTGTTLVLMTLINAAALVSALFIAAKYGRRP